MDLYYHPLSDHSRKAWAVATHLDLPLTLHLVDVAKGEHKAPAYLKLNPTGRIPTMTDGEYVLWESNAITQYMATHASNGADLWPDDPDRRADVSRWQFWELLHWTTPANAAILERVFKPQVLGAPGDEDAALKGEATWTDSAAVLDAHLAGRDWIVGDGPTLADFSIAPATAFTEPAKLPLDRFPNIRKWYANVEQLDAWKKTAPAM